MRDGSDTKYKRTEFIFNEVARITEHKEDDVALIKKILTNRELKKKMVLEVGCGFGDNLLYCARNGADYAEGFDISAESIKLAQSKAKDMKNVLFHKCNIEEYETSKRFDIILAIGVFEYFDRPLEALEKLCCLTSEGGTLIALISKPIFIKKISFLCRPFLSRVPQKMVLSVADAVDGICGKFSLFFNKRLSTATSSTYTMKRVILEGLMVNRYNVIEKAVFCDHLKKRSFDVAVFDDVSPSMTCVVGTRKD